VGSATSRPRTTRTSLGSREIEERRTKNLCFFCDEAYFPGHKCKVQVYSLEVVTGIKEDEEEEVERLEGKSELEH